MTRNSAGIGRGEAETKAYREEALAALYFIGSAVAFGADMRVFGWLLGVKGVLDTLSAFAAWMKVFRARQPQQAKD